jgi:hypothetical protein
MGGEIIISNLGCKDSSKCSLVEAKFFSMRVNKFPFFGS